MGTTKQAATLTTTAAGRSLSVYRLRAGQYIWHKGAFRLVTAVELEPFRPVVRMGRHALKCVHATTVEVAA